MQLIICGTVTVKNPGPEGSGRKTSKLRPSASRKQSQHDLMFDSDGSLHLTSAELIEFLFLVTMV
jgi:hypothetical protein